MCLESNMDTIQEKMHKDVTIRKEVMIQERNNMVDNFGPQMIVQKDK